MVRLVVWVVVAVLVLSFFGVSLKALVEDPTTQNNFAFIGDLVEDGWNMIVEWFSQFRDDAQDIIDRDALNNLKESI